MTSRQSRDIICCGTIYYKDTVCALREAQRHPEKHRDLIVRIAGYSDCFVDLSTELQNKIITRTEHLGF